MKVIGMGKMRNLFGFMMGLSLVAACFYNCSPNSHFLRRSLEGDMSNGGGYNGPNLYFPLIPPVDPSESATDFDIGTQLVQAQMRCQFGAPERGLTGIYNKISQIFINKRWLPCELQQVSKDPSFGYLIDYSKNKNLTSFCQSQGPSLIKSQALQNQGEIINLKSTSFSTFDDTIDPPVFIENEEWAGTKFKFMIADSGMNPLKHFSVAGTFPMALFAGTGGGNQLPSLQKRIVLSSESFIGEKIPIMKSVEQVESGGYFNTFEYMSCVQGEFYFAQNPQVEHQKAIPINLPEVYRKSQKCSILDPWIDALNARKSFGMSRRSFDTQFSAVFDSWDQEYSVRKMVAGQIFEAYLRGELNLDAIGNCLSTSPQRLDFLYTMQSLFFFKTIDHLKARNDTSLTELMNKVVDSTEGKVWTMFYVSGVGASQGSKAGVHREQLSTFMNLLKIPSNEWLVVFIHEMVHRLDTVMLSSASAFSSADLLGAVRSELKSPAPNKEILRRWILHGFQRGLLAEFRAWRISFQHYEKLLADKEIKNNLYFDSYLEGHKASDPGFDCFLLGKLSQQEELSPMEEFKNQTMRDIASEVLTEIRGCGAEYLQ